MASKRPDKVTPTPDKNGTLDMLREIVTENLEELPHEGTSIEARRKEWLDRRDEVVRKGIEAGLSYAAVGRAVKISAERVRQIANRLEIESPRAARMRRNAGR